MIRLVSSRGGWHDLPVGLAVSQRLRDAAPVASQDMFRVNGVVGMRIGRETAPDRRGDSVWIFLDTTLLNNATEFAMLAHLSCAESRRLAATVLTASGDARNQAEESLVDVVRWLAMSVPPDDESSVSYRNRLGLWSVSALALAVPALIWLLAVVMFLPDERAIRSIVSTQLGDFGLRTQRADESVVGMTVTQLVDQLGRGLEDRLATSFVTAEELQRVTAPPKHDLPTLYACERHSLLLLQQESLSATATAVTTLLNMVEEMRVSVEELVRRLTPLDHAKRE